MPAEQFRPMPSSEPEEIPREKTQYNIPVPKGDLPGEETKIVRLEDVQRKGPPPIPEAARKKVVEEFPDLDESIEELQPEPMRFAKLEDIERKGPPPIPEAAKRKGPPPIPEAVRKASMEAFQKRMENAQERDIVDAFEVQGFDDLDVGATMEKKTERVGSPEKLNEDNILIDPETGLIGVLDGLGGEGEAGAGARASKAAELVIPETYKEAKLEADALDNREVQNRLVEQQLVKAGNPEARKAVTELMEQLIETDPKMAKEALALIEAVRGANDSVKESGGKTTALISKIHETPDGRRFALIANIGDCAAYKQRANGEIVQITEEDSALNSLKRAGVLDEALLAEMKKDKTKKHPIPLSLKVIQSMGGGEEQFKQFQEKGVKSLPLSLKDLKRAMVAGLGSEVFEPSLTVRELKPGESIFFATDGQMDIVEDAETGEFDSRQVLLDMSGEPMQKFFDPSGNVDMEKLRKKVMSLSLTDRLNNMRAAAAKSEKKDDDIAIVGATAR